MNKPTNNQTFFQLLMQQIEEHAKPAQDIFVNTDMSKLVKFPFPRVKPASMHMKEKEKDSLDTTSTDASPGLVRVIHCFDKFNPKGGVTIAYNRCNSFKNSRMVNVAVTYCSNNDNFNRKIGTALTLEKFNAGQTVMIPAWTKDADITQTLRNVFWNSLEISDMYI